MKVRLKSVIDTPSADSTWKFGDKLMYGTDWHMIHKESGHKLFPEYFAQVFNDPQLKGWARSFFARNAINFLQLEAAVEKPIFQSQRDSWNNLITRAKGGP